MSNSRIVVPDAELIVDRFGGVLGMGLNGKDSFFARVLAGSGVASSHTGDTLKTELARCVVPAGSLLENGSLRITTLWSFTASVNGKTLRAEVGDVDILSGHLINDASNVGAHHDRVIYARGSQNAQIVMSSYGGSGVTYSNANVGTVDFSKDQTISISGQLALGTETITLEAWTVLLMPNK